MSSSSHISNRILTINNNCLFAVAVFIGLALNPGGNTDPSLAKNVVTFHVCSFTCFFVSTFVELGLMQLLALRISNSPKILRNGMLVSSVGSACGLVFMTLALINVVQMKLSCRSPYSDM